MTKLIVTADDFGTSMEVNEAIEDAHRRGILTAASLMVGEPFAVDAVDRARGMPGLGVGLHVALSRARPVSPPDRIPDLVDRSGRLRADLVGAGFRFFFLSSVRRQLATEITAQFEAFFATGLRLDHVNAHNHLHLHPTVLGLILKIGRPYGMNAIRLPKDRNAKGPGARFLAPWLALMQWRLEQHGIRHNDVLLGLGETGALDAKTLVSLIAGLSEGTAELMCHPATGPWAGMDPMARDFRHDLEYEALIDPSTIDTVRDSGVDLVTYGDME